jgi:hypothetical protein
MQKMTGTQAILMPAHATKAHGVDGWAEEQMALRSQWERMTGGGRAQQMADIAQNLGRIRLAARRGRLGQISETAIAQLEQQAQELAQELRGA